MADGGTTYSVRIAFPQYLDRERSQTARLPVHEGSGLVAPSSGTYALLDPNGVELASGAVVITAKVATFALDALSATQALGYGYREVWTLAMPDGTTHVWTRDVVVVPRELYPVVTDDDLLAVYSDLGRQRPSTMTSFEVPRLEAWKRILSRLEGQGNLPNLIGTPWSLREVHLELSLYLLAQDLRTGQRGKWEDLAEHHKREFEFAWRRLKFRELAEDGTEPVTGALESAEGTLWSTSAPATSWGF